MIRRQFFLTREQDEYLKYLSLEGFSVSEHIRLAVDAYIATKKREVGTSRMSPTGLRKEGIQNG